MRTNFEGRRASIFDGGDAELLGQREHAQDAGTAVKRLRGLCVRDAHMYTPTPTLRFSQYSCGQIATTCV